VSAAVPGIYPTMPMAEYLALDALSATPVRYALDQCPRAGWFASRLNPERVREESEIFDLGTIAHRILLEGSTAGVAIINPEHYPTKSNGNIPKGWTNNEIRAARDLARLNGLQPILLADYAEVETMITVAREFIASLQTTEPAIWGAFQPDGGRSEVTMIWEDDDGLMCKLRTDRIANEHGVVVDYKTTGQSAEPERFGRAALSGLGYSFGAAWYRRGIEKLTGVVPAFVFLAQETAAPFLCSLPGLDPARIAYDDERVGAGIALWNRCLRTGQWDGYANRVCYPALPAWERAKWDERVTLNHDGIAYGSQY